MNSIRKKFPLIRILFLIDTLRAGGKERQLVELLKKLSLKPEFELDLLLMKQAVEYSGVYDLKVKIHFLNRKIKFDPVFFFKLYKMVRRIKPDILHAWSAVMAFYVGPIARLLKIKNICGLVRGATNVKKYSRTWLFEKIGFIFSDKIIANSQAGLYSRNLSKNKKAMVIRNGFDFSRIGDLEDPVNIKKRFGITTDRIVGMVGSLDDRKDNEVFIQAAKQIISRRKDVTFLIVGEGPKYDRLKSLVDEKEKGRIVFTGRQDKIESIINIFDIGVLTSKNEFFREGISNSIMEYMALEKPVVATDSGGNPEIVGDTITGYLVKPKDPEKLVDRIEYLLTHPQIAGDMGKAGKRKIINEFDLNRMSDAYIQFYRNLIIH